MEALLSMGGYGGYVWPAYIISALTLGALAFWIVRRAARAKARLEEGERKTGKTVNG